MNPTPSAPGLAERFALIAEGLYHVLAKYIGRDWNAGPLILLACGRLRRRAARFAILVERMRAGILPAPSGQRRRTARRAPGDGAPERPAPVKLPRDHGWALRWMKHEAALYAFRLGMFMDDPELPALLAASPQAAGLLRAMWRMLTADPLPELLRPKPRAARASPPAALPASRAEAGPGTCSFVTDREDDDSLAADVPTDDAVPVASGKPRRLAEPARAGLRDSSSARRCRFSEA